MGILIRDHGKEGGPQAPWLSGAAPLGFIASQGEMPPC